MTAGAHPHGTDLVGTMLENRYRIDSTIARGGMSSVYRGLDSRLDRPVALKVMDARFSGDRSFIDRFEREARAAARLHHPNVVAVYDQGVDRAGGEDSVYLVMQLVEGGTLRDLIAERGSLPPAVALTVMEAVLSALAAAHDAGMVHRDIKPENVLIGPGDSVKVADFGLVRAVASAGTTSGSVILGTVAYLSPEQVTTGAADARTDVYAAGVVLHEMLTGEPPYTGDTALSVAYRHVNDDIAPPGHRVPGLPAAVDELVVKATRRDPSMRPADAAAFRAELNRVRDTLGTGPVTVPVPETDQHTERLRTREDDPPTERITPVPEGFATSGHGAGSDRTPTGGPRATRALVRPAEKNERTDELRAVPDEDGPTRRKRSRRGRLLTVVALVVLLLAGLVGGTAWWLGSARYIEVPAVAGKRLTAAEQALRAAGLKSEVTRSYHNTVPAETVIEASPDPGSRVLSSNVVTLRVSRGRPKVPEISPGTPVAEAKSTLRDAKLSPRTDSAAARYHPSVPEGKVVGLNPAAGTAVPISSTVTIVVSKGPAPVPVPDVRGKSREQAFTALRQAGFEPYVAGQEFVEDVAAGHVVHTKPAAGTEVAVQDKPRVGVVVSNAVTVPNFTGMRVEQARRKASEAGVKLNVKSVFGRENARVLGQHPFPGSTVEKGTTVTVTAW